MNCWVSLRFSLCEIPELQVEYLNKMISVENVEIDQNDLEKWRLDFTTKIEDPPIAAEALEDFKRRFKNSY